MGGVFEALGDPVRRLLLELLAAGEQPVGPLVTAVRSRLPISQPAVSQHLKVLLEADLVTVRASGTRRLYTLNQAGLNAARAWLTTLADPIAPFEQPLDALATEIARGRRAGRVPAASPLPPTRRLVDGSALTADSRPAAQPVGDQDIPASPGMTA